jgi:hypothetical protein
MLPPGRHDVGFAGPSNYWHDGRGQLHCPHGVILYGTSCIQCERNAVRLTSPTPFQRRAIETAILRDQAGELLTQCGHGVVGPCTDCALSVPNSDGCGQPQGDRRGDWIQTFTGRQYWPLDPHADDVTIEDIAHHLSMLCRYTGACEQFYSVAEHSVHVSHIVPPHLALWGLLHDASEAYCNDIARPVKRSITGYTDIEGANEQVIYERFNVTAALEGDLPDAQAIKKADNAMLLAEQEVIMKPPPAAWAPIVVPPEMLAAAHKRLDGFARWQPAKAERIFQRRFLELGRGLWPTGRPVRDIQRLQRRQAADLKIREFADTYSPDMKAGEVYSVPFHMLVTHRQNGGI